MVMIIKCSWLVLLMFVVQNATSDKNNGVRSQADVKTNDHEEGLIPGNEEAFDPSLIPPVGEIALEDLNPEFEDFSSLPDDILDQSPTENINGILLDTAATSIGLYLKAISRKELGISHMQRIFDHLPYSEILRKKPMQTVEDLAANLDRKLKELSSILNNGAATIQSSFYLKTLLERQPAPYSNANPILINCCALHASDLDANDTQYGFLPVDKSTACEVQPGFASSNAFSAGLASNMSKMFRENFNSNPRLKWQYFMGTDGLHLEYPASRLSSSKSHVPLLSCGQHGDARHRDIYLSNLHPTKKHVILILDNGRALTSKQFQLGISIVRYVISSLSPGDKLAVFSISNSVQFPMSGQPPQNCTRHELRKLSFDNKQKITHFLNEELFQDSLSAANHTRAIIEVKTVMLNSKLKSDDQVHILYATRGFLTEFSQKQAVFKELASLRKMFPQNVMINTYALVDLEKGPSTMFESQFLQQLSAQDFKRHSIEINREVIAGQYIIVNSTTMLASIIGDFCKTEMKVEQSTQNMRLHLPAFDSATHSLVISVTQNVYHLGNFIGVLGIDIDFEDILEDLIYYTGEREDYVFIVNALGKVIIHPRLTDTETSDYFPTKTYNLDISEIEDRPQFIPIRSLMLNKTVGSEYLNYGDEENPLESNAASKRTKKYTWQQIASSEWIVVMVSYEDKNGNDNHEEMKTQRIIGRVANYELPPILHHRVNLLTAENQAKLCRHFSSPASLETGSLFISPRGFTSPSAINEHAMNSFIAFLSDTTRLISNPGLKDSIRNEVLALVQITNTWRNMSLESGLNNYIVKRYAATKNGLLFSYPASPVSHNLAPSHQKWFLSATEFPGRVVLSPPVLDSGGAGFIVTLSHTIYEGKLVAIHGPRDKVAAILGMDLTFGYIYKMLLETLPFCHEPNMRCFLFDNAGNIIVHPKLLVAGFDGQIAGQHIAHLEPTVMTDLLNHRSIVTKRFCHKISDYTIQRRYEFNTSYEGVITNLVYGEHCEKYQVAAMPGTNVFVAVVNVTCEMSTAFCPCSIDARKCFNCADFSHSCECPCECSVQEHGPCHDAKKPLQTKSQFLHIPACPLDGQKTKPILFTPQEKSIINSLPPCFETGCGRRSDKDQCLGVMACAWCSMEKSSDAIKNWTHIKQPFCAAQEKCFGGALGAKSPYTEIYSQYLNALRGVHADDGMLRNRPIASARSSPIGPIAGGIIGFFVVLAASVYCYKHQTSHNTNQNSRLLTNGNNANDNSFRTANADDGVDDGCSNRQLEGHLNIIAVDSSANAANANDIQVISPYRMNPSYRRPPPGTDSDHGYSTMTPMGGDLDSEIMPYAASEVGAKRHERFRRPMAGNSLHSVTSGISTRTSSPVHNLVKNTVVSAADSVMTALSPVRGTSRTHECLGLLDEGLNDESAHNSLQLKDMSKCGGTALHQTVLNPNQILADVTVHMVDTSM